MARADDDGRAFKKSQLQMQLYVNRRRSALTAATLSALPSLAAVDATLDWVSPLEADRFEEYYDGAFLKAIGRSDLRDALALYWPRSGPRWDALAVARSKSGDALGPVLVEAKSWPGEMRSRITATADSAEVIERRLQETRAWLGVAEDRASVWSGRYYQYANRLAYLRWFLDVLGERAWLLNLYVLCDPDAPTDQAAWTAALAAADAELGLADGPVPNAGRAFVSGGKRAELLAPLSD